MGVEKDGSVFGPQADEKDEAPRESGQVGVRTRASDYAETGHLAVGQAPDGGVMMGGGMPPEPAPGLTAFNLICVGDPATGREECAHYVAFITDAEGVSKGFEQQRQIRRFCTRLATASELWELGEVSMYACTARRPQDLVSIRIVRDFEAEQRRRAAETARESGEVDL